MKTTDTLKRNPEMTLTLTYEQVRYLQETAIYHYRSNCLAWEEDGPEMMENENARAALQTAISTLDYDDEGNVWQVTR